MSQEDSLQNRYLHTLEKIDRAAKMAGRSPGEVELVVISKNHPAQMVLDLIGFGAHNFGENRDQEAMPKAKEVDELTAEDITWHFVGQLQTNKVKSVLTYASVLHSLDRESLLSALAKGATESSNPLDVFIQLNLTEDPARGGVEPRALLSFAEKVLSVPTLNLKGVMGVASLDKAPAVDFETIRQASLALQGLAPGAKSISAGMSEDFEEAIAYGATHVRVGSAITGKRQY